MQIRPLGTLTFNKSTAADVVAYNLYGVAVTTAADGTTTPVVAYDNLVGSTPAPAATEAKVSFDLSTLNGLKGATGETYSFAVASVDATGNVSDLSASIIHPLDQTPPDAPTGLEWVAAVAA